MWAFEVVVFFILAIVYIVAFGGVPVTCSTKENHDYSVATED